MTIEQVTTRRLDLVPTIALLVVAVALSACATATSTSLPPTPALQAATVEPTASLLPSATATAGVTLTPSPTATRTPDPTATWTPTANPTPSPTPTPLAGGGWIAFSTYLGGNWDIYALRLDVGPGEEPQLVRQTSDPAEDRYPAYSPDGRTLAFASRRDGYWNLYLRTVDGTIRKLTDDRAYDGAPAWSPDGKRIAFDSMRDGNLDVWVMDADGGAPVNLTAESPAGEIDPVWSPDGREVAFTSWRYGDQDVFSLDLETGALRQLTSSPADEHLAAWTAEGELLYTLVDGERQEVYARPQDLDPEEQGRQLTHWLYADAPAWALAGEPRTLAFLYRQPHGTRLYLQRPEVKGDLPTRLTEELPVVGPLAWTGTDAAWAEAQGGETVLHTERTSPGEGAPYDLIQLDGVKVGNPWLSDRVDDSFAAMRQRVIDETGHDFFAELSDAWRGVSYDSARSSYTSWHKAGRAIDTLMDYLSTDRRQRWLEVALEPGGGEVYWRLYLRCERQDGSQGLPLKARPWDVTAGARSNLRGGYRKAIPDGYYADLTDLMAQYGWLRIASHDSPNFHWHTNFVALEYWHFQKTDRLSWYEAMLELFPAELMESHHRWAVQQQKGTPAWLAAAKGIPLPRAEQRKLDMFAP